MSNIQRPSATRRIPKELSDIMEDIGRKNNIPFVEAGRAIAKIIKKDTFNKRKFLEEIKI